MQRRTLLVIDDEPAITKLIRRVAEACGYGVFATSDFAEFRQILGEASPGVICLDLAMPYVDGVEILGYLADRGCPARLIIISGFDRRLLASALSLAEGRGLDVAATMAKPLRMDALKQLLLEVGPGR